MSKMISLDDQLKNPSNFIEDGKLYLVRCMNCGIEEVGRENYCLAVSSGYCAWCGWRYTPPAKEANS